MFILAKQDFPPGTPSGTHVLLATSCAHRRGWTSPLASVMALKHNPGRVARRKKEREKKNLRRKPKIRIANANAEKRKENIVTMELTVSLPVLTWRY